MVNGYQIVKAFVDKLRAIPDLIVLVADSADAIIPYYDSFPGATSLRDAIYRMPRPGILVTWDGEGPGRKGTRSHNLTLYFRAAEAFTQDEGYARMIQLIQDGVSSGDNLPMFFADVHPDCWPMGENDNGSIPSSKRDSLVIDEVGNTVDFFRAAVTFSEKRDTH